MTFAFYFINPLDKLDILVIYIYSNILSLGLSWLNDEVMNFYYGLIAGRAKANPDLPSVHHFSTFFYQTLSNSGYARVKRWTRKINIFDFER